MPTGPERVLAVGCLILLVLIPDVLPGANNLHAYDGVTTPEIIGNDVFFEIVDPEDLQFTYRLRLAKDFGVTFGDSFKRHSHVLVPTEPGDACMTIDNIEDIEGNIALIERGGCTFISKAIRAANVGASAVIITDLDTKSIDADSYIEMVHDETSADVDIPVAYLLGKNGQMILSTLSKLRMGYAIINIPVNLTFTPPEEINHPPWVGW